MSKELEEIIEDLKSDREIILDEINSVDVQVEIREDSGNSTQVVFDRDRADYKQKLLGLANKNNETRLKALDKKKERLPEDEKEDEESEEEMDNIFELVKKNREVNRRSG